VPPELPLRYESTNAQFVIQYADAQIDLKKLGRVGSFTTADRWKTVTPSDEERALFRWLVKRLDDEDDRVHAQAGYFLSLLDDPEGNRLVAAARRARTLNRLADAPRTMVEKAWLMGPFDDGAGGLETVHPPEQGPIDLSVQLASGKQSLSWQSVSLAPAGEFHALPAPAPEASSYLYFRLQSFRPQDALLILPGDIRCKLWHNSRAISDLSPMVLSLDPGSNDILLRVRQGAKPLGMMVGIRSADRVEPMLPEKLGLGTLAQRLQTAGQGDGTKVPAEFLSVDWANAATRGDAERGRRLFGADALGCVKCHGVLPNQKGAGAPSLADAAKRFTTSHLIESILAPSKQVAPVFGTTAIVTVDGKTLSGLVIEENDRQLVLLLPTAARQEVAKSQIEDRKLQNASPMPSGLVKTPAELADLLAYLLSPNPQAP
jgi:putative heme-binding domain-containing protein